MKVFKSRVFVLCLLAVVAVAVGLTGCRRDGPKVFRMSDNQPDGYPTVLGDLAFAQYVNEKTDGKIKIEVFNNSVLGNEKETIEMTQTGSIHFIRVGINPLSAINPITNAFGMPFLFRDRDHMFRVLDGQVGEDMLEALQQQNLLGLSWMDAGFRNFYNSKREIRIPSDMQGLRIRVQESPLMMEMVRLLGASPTPMAYGDVYAAIQNGVIEGAENNWPSFITAAHHEVAPFFTVNQHMASPEMILVNTRVWNSFSDEEKQIIKEGAKVGAMVQREAWLEAEKQYEAQARAAGTTITELTPEERQLFVDALMPLYDKPEYAQFAEIVQRVRDTP